jgi:hypothetical protein
MPKYKPLPPLARLNELFEVIEIPPDNYGEWSGLVWKTGRGSRRAGSVVGTLMRLKNRKNRVDWRARIDGVDYLVARIIYYMTHSEDFGHIQIDHIDQKPLNNNVWNLRLDIDGHIQQINTPMQQSNTSGVVGVSWNKTARKWKAYVTSEGKLKHLGVFTCKFCAARVVRDKWIELGWSKLGRKLPDLSKIECDCSNCSNMTLRPSDPAE